MMRALSALLVLLLLALPRGEAEAAAPIARDLAPVGHADEDGACEEIEPQELLACGAQHEVALDEPLVISLLRRLDVRLTKAACDELLADVWSQQICAAGSRECGKLNAGAPPRAPQQWTSSGATGLSSHSDHDPSADVRRLAFADRTRNFDSRDLQPPVPPPRLSVH